MARRCLLVISILAAGLAAAAAGAQTGGGPDSGSVSGAMKACTWIADEAERLACFDRAARVLAVPSEAAPTPPRSRNTPVRPRRPDGDRETDRSVADDVYDVYEGEMTVAAAHPLAIGNWLLRMENGQVWRLTGGEHSSRIEPGDRVEVREGWLGGYLMTVDGNTVRAKREQ